ncbi:cyanophycin synthetase [Pilimelia columellifera]|uniref:Cyanophycin synthetase n=1 Tax=Pilimelia columellifera subsp. columellifera TaxID=706583 RepID=A0ABN3N7M1_9ACTN
MRIDRISRLRGPNHYLDRPVALARVILGELTERESTDHPGFGGRLLAELPGLAEHHCAAGRPGGFVDRLHGGTYFGHIAEHVAIELSTQVGRPVNFGRTTYAGAPGHYDIIMECPVDEPVDSPLPRRLLETAIDLVTDLLAGAPARHDPALARLRRQHEHDAFGPSTAAVGAAARRRGIPVERVDGLSLLRLGQGVRRRLVWAAMTDATSAVGVDLAGDKELTRRMLAAAGVPVAEGGRAATPREALTLHERLGSPVVVKPVAGRQGIAVHLDVDGPDKLLAAFASAVAHGGEVVVERQLTGRDFRVLVVGGRMIAAAERVAAHVIGDGQATVEQLVDRANADPRRGEGHGRELTRLAIDDVCARVLAEQGHRPDTTPAAAETVWLRRNANLSTGGASHDVTDVVHPAVAALCERVAAVLGLDVAGVDLRVPDISVPLPPVVDGAPTRSGVVEVNAAPGLRMHLAPATGRPRDVGAAIVDQLFPDPNDQGRIPTVAVTGTNGKTTVSRLTAHLLAGTGRRVGLTTTDGVYLGGQLVRRSDATGPVSARMVLDDPTAQAAVLETARGGIMRRGLGYDWTDVGVITNISADHLGQDGLTSLDDIADVKALVAERVRPGGTVVLNADDPRVRQLAERPRVNGAGRRIVWFSTAASNPVVDGHLAAGGRAFLLRAGQLVEVDGDNAVVLLNAADLAGGFGGLAPYAAANALAAAAAARSLGVSPTVVTGRLAAFRTADNPGRGVLLRCGDVHVVVDYAHNPAAIAAVAGPIGRLWGRSRAVAAVTLPGDRCDELVRSCGRALAAGFSRVALYEDHDLRGRRPGELPSLLGQEIAQVAPDCRQVVAAHPQDAVPAALAMADPGDVVLVMYEQVDEVLAVLRASGAVPVADDAAPWSAQAALASAAG